MKCRRFESFTFRVGEVVLPPIGRLPLTATRWMVTLHGCDHPHMALVQPVALRSPKPSMLVRVQHAVLLLLQVVREGFGAVSWRFQFSADPPSRGNGLLSLCGGSSRFGGETGKREALKKLCHIDVRVRFPPEARTMNGSSFTVAIPHRFRPIALIAQWIERLSPEQKVAGSTPALGSRVFSTRKEGTQNDHV